MIIDRVIFFTFSRRTSHASPTPTPHIFCSVLFSLLTAPHDLNPPLAGGTCNIFRIRSLFDPIGGVRYFQGGLGGQDCEAFSEGGRGTVYSVL